ncbi:hypothetical protein [Sphingomonas sp. RS2018]
MAELFIDIPVHKGEFAGCVAILPASCKHSRLEEAHLRPKGCEAAGGAAQRRG